MTRREVSIINFDDVLTGCSYFSRPNKASGDMRIEVSLARQERGKKIATCAQPLDVLDRLVRRFRVLGTVLMIFQSRLKLLPFKV